MARWTPAEEQWLLASFDSIRENGGDYNQLVAKMALGGFTRTQTALNSRLGKLQTEQHPSPAGARGTALLRNSGSSCLTKLSAAFHNGIATARTQLDNLESGNGGDGGDDDDGQDDAPPEDPKGGDEPGEQPSGTPPGSPTAGGKRPLEEDDDTETQGPSKKPAKSPKQPTPKNPTPTEEQPTQPTEAVAGPSTGTTTTTTGSGDHQQAANLRRVIKARTETIEKLQEELQGYRTTNESLSIRVNELAAAVETLKEKSAVQDEQIIEYEAEIERLKQELAEKNGETTTSAAKTPGKTPATAHPQTPGTAEPTPRSRGMVPPPYTPGGTDPWGGELSDSPFTQAMMDGLRAAGILTPVPVSTLVRIARRSSAFGSPSGTPTGRSGHRGVVGTPSALGTAPVLTMSPEGPGSSPTPSVTGASPKTPSKATAKTPSKGTPAQTQTPGIAPPDTPTSTEWGTPAVTRTSAPTQGPPNTRRMLPPRGSLASTQHSAPERRTPPPRQSARSPPRSF